MITFFRSILDSKIGIAVTLGFVALIAVAFAMGDVTGMSGGLGVFGGSSSVAAEVEGEEIGTGQLTQAANRALDQFQQRDPALTMQRFVREDGLDTVLDSLIQDHALAAYARKIGLAAGKPLVDSELINAGVFNGPTGKFDDTLFRQFLQQNEVTERDLRAQVERQLLTRQLLTPVGGGARVSEQLARPYLGVALERRVGQVALLPAAAFAPTEAPSDAVLQTYYSENARRYQIPERRSLRYAIFDANALRVPAPSEAQLRAEYQRRQGEFAAGEKRVVTQVIAPTEQAARALAQQAQGGGLDAAARSVGLSASTLPALTKDELQTRSSAAVANAVFAAAEGSTAAPTRSPLGWHVTHVDRIERTNARSFETVRDDLAATLQAAARQQAIATQTERIQDQLDDGASLEEIADALKLTLATSQPLTRQGIDITRSTAAPDPTIALLMNQAFLVEDENQPELFSLTPPDGVTDPSQVRFAVFEVREITPAAPPPLTQVKPLVARDWAQARGQALARTAADNIVKAVAGGKSLADALAGVGKPLPPVQEVSNTRQQLAAAERIPPPLMLLFAMAEKSVKRLEAPNKSGWFVLYLADIAPGAFDDDAAALAQTREELRRVVSQEYADQFAQAIRADLDITRNDAAVKSVADQLTGQSGQ